jgi:hypothetical protein
MTLLLKSLTQGCPHKTFLGIGQHAQT